LTALVNGEVPGTAIGGGTILSDDQVWNAFITSLPAQDQARHDLEHFQAQLLKNALQEIEDLTLEITQHTAEIQQLQDVLQGYSSLLHDVTADRDRFREDWQAMVRELSRWRPQIKGDGNGCT
jgi:chromosome segregation ATPase